MSDRGVPTPLRRRLSSRKRCGRDATLDRVRDALLPKLISGEIRVPDSTRSGRAVERSSRNSPPDGRRSEPFSRGLGPEGQLVELPALKRLCGDEPGMPVSAGPTSTGRSSRPTRGSGERSRWSDVVLDRPPAPRRSQRINPQLAGGGRRSGSSTRSSADSTSPSVIEDHRAFHELAPGRRARLLPRPSGVERHAHAWLVDFDDLANNEFARGQPAHDHRRRRRTAGRTSCCTSTACRSARSSARRPGWRSRSRGGGQPGRPLQARRSRRCTASSRSSASPT